MPPVWAPPDGDPEGFDDLDLGWLRARPGEKWAQARAGGDDVLACWVADMDFPAPAPAREALIGLADLGDFGYPDGKEEDALESPWAARMESRFGWSPSPGKVRVFTDLVQGAEAVLEAGTERGDGVLLLTPSYPPFVGAIVAMGRRLLPVPALDTGYGWAFDLDAAASGARDAKAILLVNPHNPTGRMLTVPELEAIAELAERYDLLVISDEVHADLTLVGEVHVPFASLGSPLEARTVSLYSASKSHNLGGMRCAIAHMGSARVERRLRAFPQHLLGRVSVTAVATTLASWSPAGDAWLERALQRLRANRERLSSWLGEGALEIATRGYPPQATYLCWLDFRSTGVPPLAEEPGKWLLDKAGVMLSDGATFGPGGAGFARLNFATSPGVLDEVLARVQAAVSAARRDKATKDETG